MKILLVAKKKNNYSPSAQTIHLASSGLVLVIATLLHSPCWVFVSNILYIL